MAKRATKKTEAKLIAIKSADNHLQDRAWHSRTTLAGDAYWAFQWLCGAAIERQVPLVLAGDLIDKQQNEALLVSILRRELDRLQEAEVPAYYIEGQHERQAGLPWLAAVHQHPICLHKHAYPLGPFTMEGISWQPADALPKHLAEVDPGTRILVMHQTCHEFLGGVTETELRWEQIPEGVRQLTVGDYHVHKRLERQNAGGRPLTVLSPGSTCMQSIDEPPVKQVFLLYDDLTSESLTIPGRQFLRPAPLLMEEELIQFVELAASQIEKATRVAADELQLPEHLWLPIIYVQYGSELPEAYKRIAKAVGEKAHLFLKELRPEQVEQAEEVREHDEVIEAGLLGALSQVADPDSERYKVSERLLSAVNPRQALFELRREYLKLDTSTSNAGIA